MNNEQTLSINRLPAPTWNWLGMNERRIDPISIDRALTLQPAASGDIAAENGPAPADWAQIATGMGADVDALTAAADAGVYQFSTAAGAEGAALVHLDYASGNFANRIYLHAAENSVLKLTVVLASARDAKGVAALQVKAKAERGARIRLTTVQLLAGGFTCFNDYGATLADDAKAELVRVELGAGHLYTGGEAALAGEKSDFQASIGYLGGAGEVLDMNYTARHLAKKTNSLMTAAGVLADGSSKLFRGTIDFPHGCPGSKGEEREEVLLLGDDLVNQTIPLILCAEEDVEGDHGATIGKLDDAMLFYLASRGIPAAEAERIMARARLETVCALVEEEGVREEINTYLQGKEDA
ncbi:MAG: SufD family Fe-S cluster assembly protein [Peptococcaceae bacterium]|nr:SufD family Fe-S cluster assembly protein [Peptococcaceae bacterium]